MTRRSFLELVGQTGGAAAVHGAMRALHLTADAPPLAFEPRARGRAPRGTRVLVLGAGLTGLTAAYELRKLGYDARVLEARTRAGGRCFTVRQGTAGEEAGAGAGQIARFDPGLYLNAGPMRIPHHHTTTLHYCRELGVPIEQFCSGNEAAFVHQSTASDPAARRPRLRELRGDWRGYTSELLAKAIAQPALAQPMTADDRDRIVDWLRKEGALGADLHYAGTRYRGYRTMPGAGEHPGELDDPLRLSTLVQSGFGSVIAGDLNLQWPMFQAVGGMDRIAAALAERTPQLTLGAEVLAIEQPPATDWKPSRVRVRYRDRASGTTHEAEADYCICTLPLPVLAEIALDVAPAVRDAVRAVKYSSAGKIGLQFKRRFWEEDDGIYGGVTRTDLEIAQIVYPSYGYLSRKGLLIGYYQMGANAIAMAERTAPERTRIALEQGAQIHPQYPAEFEQAFSVAWHKMPFSRGGWAQFTPDQRTREYLTLLQPDRALYFAGDHLTYQIAWMQGAFESARGVVQALHQRAVSETAAMTAQH